MHCTFWSDQSNSLLSNLLSSRRTDSLFQFSRRWSTTGKALGHLSTGWNVVIVNHSPVVLRFSTSSSWRARLSLLKVRSLRVPNWTSLNSCLRTCDSPLHLDLLLESVHDILSFNLVNLGIRVLLDEIINGHVATANSYHNLITLLDLDINTFLAKLVDTFRFSEEKNVHLLPFWEFIDEISESSIDGIVFLRNINSLIFL